MGTSLDKRAQETAKAFRMESLSLYDQAPSSNRKAATSGEVTSILDGFSLILSENIQQPEYHSYLFSDFSDYLEAAS